MDKFKFRLNWTIDSGLRFSAEKCHIRPCLEHSLFRFDWIFIMKAADKLDRHKISDKFEFRPDWTIDSGVTCPLVPKNSVCDLV